MAASNITVVVVTVGTPRRSLLRRALDSVWAQTLQPDQVIVSQDNDRDGAPWVRQAGTECVMTPYVAYLDDDDEFMPHHLQALAGAIGDADLVFPWFEVAGGTDPFPHYFGVPWDDSQHRQIPVTFLARTDAIQRARGWLTDWTSVEAAEDPGTDPEGNRAGEDYQLVRRLVANGAKIVHHPDRTWIYHHDSQNTMGLPSRVAWDQVG